MISTRKSKPLNGKTSFFFLKKKFLFQFTYTMHQVNHRQVEGILVPENFQIPPERRHFEFFILNKQNSSRKTPRILKFCVLITQTKYLWHAAPNTLNKCIPSLKFPIQTESKTASSMYISGENHN